MRRSFEEKLNVVSQAKRGKPIRLLSRKYGLHESKILEWVRKYDIYGEIGLRKRPKIKATGAIKKKLVRLFLGKDVTLAQIVVQYQVSRSAMESWVRQVRKHGYDALYIERPRGRPPKDPMARPKKQKPQTELERLQAENLRLRAENALLKKVKALVAEQEARAQLNGHKPSTS